MADSAIQESAKTKTADPTELRITEEAKPNRIREPDPQWWQPLQLLKIIASLRVTVVLFVLSFLLVFFNTMAQKNMGNFQATVAYFRSWVVWVPFQQFVEFFQTFPGIWKDTTLPGSFPFPGGWILGGALMINLVAAHLTRFRISWKRSGILVLHAGIILLLVGELITGVFAKERNLTVEEGFAVNYVYDLHDFEIAVVDTSDPKFNDEVLIPSHVIRNGGTIGHDELPVDLEIVKFMENSDIRRVKANYPNEIHDRKDYKEAEVLDMRNRSTGMFYAAFEKERTSGTEASGRVDTPSAYVTVKKKGTGESLGTYLLGVEMPRLQVFRANGKPYELHLRLARYQKPYSFFLDDFQVVYYPGTKIPHKYVSDLTLLDPERGENRKVTISMNEPLRYEGETFYQSSHDPRAVTTTLQVVDNPGRDLPYISCTVITLGMMIHFGILLTNFLKKRSAQPPVEQGAAS